MGIAGGLGGAATGATMGAAFGPIGMGVGALAGGLLGGLAGPDGGGGGGPSGAGPGALPIGGGPTNQIVNLDVTNNNIAAPISVNVGGTQSIPDGTIGTRGMTSALPISYADYGTLDYQSKIAYVDELGSPIFHDGFPFGSDPAPSAGSSPIMAALPFVLVGLAALVLVKRMKKG